MKLKDIIRADKNVTDWGKWQDGGKMPRTAFPLSKTRNRAFRLPSFRWRVVLFDALGETFRLLVAYRADKEQYRAVLAADYERDMAVLAQYEFHGTHPGWHVHVMCDEIDTIPTGVMRHPKQRRIPKARAGSRHADFLVANDDRALDVAAGFFRLHQTEGVLGL